MKHTKKEFLNIMNKHFKRYCSETLPGRDYEPCIKYKESNRKILDYNNKHHKIGFDQSKKSEKIHEKLVKKCQKFKKTVKKRYCNLEDFITFSGAERR